mmetsp:Transcript_16316/g.55424  ORF Transcript_16316/g.55424 Transcript_16316/m.55424 type:complete len:86 (-) Transcript_16316:585-842(-)
MTEHDMRTARELLEEDFIRKNDAWRKELELMLETRTKAEIQVRGSRMQPLSVRDGPPLLQALSAFGFTYLSEEFLPRKLLQGDWI